jgi:putative ABC transport system ATP-binding protein
VPEAETAVEVRGLVKSYGDGPARAEALRGVDLTVAPGEFVAITGPSGTGKSTLLHLIAGLDVPTAGSVSVFGTDVGRLGDDERCLLRLHRVGLVFQSFNLVEILDAEENVALPFLLAGGAAAAARRRARRLLGRVGLATRGRHRPGQLSGGERQRVAVARALVMDPLLLLADEPTGSLDSDNGAAVLALIREVAGERRQTTLVVTHDPGLAATAGRRVRLCDGRVTDAGVGDGVVGIHAARPRAAAGPDVADGPGDRGRGGDGGRDSADHRRRAA